MIVFHSLFIVSNTQIIVPHILCNQFIDRTGNNCSNQHHYNTTLEIRYLFLTIVSCIFKLFNYHTIITTKNYQGKQGGGGRRYQEQSRKIFIGGLNYNTTEDTLKEHFSQYGELVDIVVMKFPDTKRYVQAIKLEYYSHI